MTAALQDIPSVVERTRQLTPGAPVIAAHFLGDTAALVLTEETVLLVAAADAEHRVSVHAGGILAAATDGARLVTGGDDGKVASTAADGSSQTIATDARRRWIDRVAAAGNGAVAWSAGKQAFVVSGDGAPRSIDLPSSPGGLAFAPKGFRLAVAHYNGVTLWFPNAPEAKPEVLDWKGSHLDVTFSPDGKFLVTSMQEPALHGWRLADAKNMRMSGYAAKVRSLAWTADGKWLATSGANQLILWPFQGKDGPMGKQPRMLAAMEPRVAAVACHPVQDVVAVGYEDGLLLLVRLDDGAEILARRPAGSPISALVWHREGGRLAFGTEDGHAGIIDLA
jgi:WD40 repeat protein